MRIFGSGLSSWNVRLCIRVLGFGVPRVRDLKAPGTGFLKIGKFLCISEYKPKRTQETRMVVCLREYEFAVEQRRRRKARTWDLDLHHHWSLNSKPISSAFPNTPRTSPNPRLGSFLE